MSHKIFFTVLFMLVSAMAFAQGQDEDLPRHDVRFAVGAAMPVGSATTYLNTAPLIALTYGYRLNRFFQAEGGFQMAFGAANNQNAEDSEFGTVQGGDHEYMIPFSGRFIIPLPFKRFEFSAGGGLAYLHYGETATSGATYCFSCTTRGGWGTQGSGDVKYFLGEDRMFYIRGTLQHVGASLNGQAVGNVPGIRTYDHWNNLLFGVGFRF